MKTAKIALIAATSANALSLNKQRPGGFKEDPTQFAEVNA